MTNKNDAKDLLNVIDLVLCVGTLFIGQDQENRDEEPSCNQSNDFEMPQDVEAFSLDV